MSLVGLNGEPLSPGQPQPSTGQTQPGEDQTPEEPPAPTRVTTAFLVVVQPTGRVVVTDNLAEAIVPMRGPTYDDIIGAAANIQAELTARKAADMAAAATVQTQLAVSRQLQEQQLHQQVQDALAAGAKG